MVPPDDGSSQTISMGLCLGQDCSRLVHESGKTRLHEKTTPFVLVAAPTYTKTGKRDYTAPTYTKTGKRDYTAPTYTKTGKRDYTAPTYTKTGKRDYTRKLHRLFWWLLLRTRRRVNETTLLLRTRRRVNEATLLLRTRRRVNETTLLLRTRRRVNETTRENYTVCSGGCSYVHEDG